MTADWRSAGVDWLRTLITKAEPDAVEEAKWRKESNPDGVPTFSSSGLICTVETYRDKVKLTFAKGAALDDPSGLFNASLNAPGTRRAIDIREDDEIDEKAFIALVREAVSLNQSLTMIISDGQNVLASGHGQKPVHGRDVTSVSSRAGSPARDRACWRSMAVRA